jgi:hypothetical protein
VGSGRTPDPDPARGEIARLRAAGLGWKAIARDLNDRQVPTPSGRGRWWPESVRRHYEPGAWSAYMRAYRQRRTPPAPAPRIVPLTHPSAVQRLDRQRTDRIAPPPAPSGPVLTINLFPVEHAATLLHTDPATLRRAVVRGDLAAHRIDGQLRFAATDLAHYRGWPTRYATARPPRVDADGWSLPALELRFPGGR